MSLSVSATGPGTLSLIYQWIKDGEPITDDIIKYPNCTGYDTPTLYISSLSAEHDGNYVCKVSYNEDCSVLSNSVEVRGMIHFSYSKCNVMTVGLNSWLDPFFHYRRTSN